MDNFANLICLIISGAGIALGYRSYKKLLASDKALEKSEVSFLLDSIPPLPKLHFLRDISLGGVLFIILGFGAIYVDPGLPFLAVCALGCGTMGLTYVIYASATIANRNICLRYFQKMKPKLMFGTIDISLKSQLDFLLGKSARVVCDNGGTTFIFLGGLKELETRVGFIEIPGLKRLKYIYVPKSYHHLFAEG